MFELSLQIATTKQIIYFNYKKVIASLFNPLSLPVSLLYFVIKCLFDNYVDLKNLYVR